MSSMTRQDLVSAIQNICCKFADSKELLNDLDSQMGDGDLGTTLSAVSGALLPKLDTFPNDIGACFGEVAQIIAATSGSSFSAISMFGLLKIASRTKGCSSMSWRDLPDAIDQAIEEMSSRGGAKLGDKTVLDGLAAISQTLREQPESTDISAAANAAVIQALLEFKNKPSGIGRARVAGERNVGMDDPGMFALHLAVGAL